MSPTAAAQLLLNPDIVPHIVQLADNPTLLALLRVNRYLHEAAGKQLYHAVIAKGRTELVVRDLLPGMSRSKDQLLAYVRYLALGFNVVMAPTQRGRYELDPYRSESELEEWGDDEEGSDAEEEVGEGSDAEEEVVFPKRVQEMGETKGEVEAAVAQEDNPGRHPDAAEVIGLADNDESDTEEYASESSAAEEDGERRGAGGLVNNADDPNCAVDVAGSTRSHIRSPQATSPPALSILPALYALRFRIASNCTTCQNEVACMYCDFFVHLRPKVWVIDGAHSLFHALADVGAIPESLETVIMGFNLKSNTYISSLYQSDAEYLLGSLSASVRIIVVYSGLEETAEAPSTSIAQYVVMLNGLVTLCAAVPHAITIAGSTSDRTFWVRHDVSGDPGPWDVEAELRRRVREAMQAAGKRAEEVVKRLGSIRCIETRELEGEAWTPVMGAAESSEWW